ncbi:MAG: FtsW/RodA/SpoVE family cell cycle protein [Lachnospiraceae bacterium]|nr:FtsW/RodA/SpoVE family cell cycle protein [Lachnospiraceae bacterium]
MLSKLFNFKNYRLASFDFMLLIYVLILSAIGAIILHSATINAGDTAYQKHLMGIGVGIACVCVLCLTDYHVWMKLRVLFYLLALGFLVVTFLFGTDSGTGAQRWLVLPGVGQIQPSEFVKIALIMFFAGYFGAHEEYVNSPLTVLGSGVLILVPLLMIFRQPNLSTTLVTATIFVGIVFVAGVSWKWFAGVLASLVPVGLGLFIYAKVTGNNILRGYMLNRIFAFTNIGAAEATDLNRQQLNSVMAIGSGGLGGKGLFNATFESVKNGNFLMEEDCDFIFAVVGEELGFIGSCVVLGLILLIILRLLSLAKSAQDMGARLFCAGMAVLIGFQSFVNVGVATHLLPNTGVPLPFVSAGLSSMLSLYMGIGVVLNISLQRRKVD